MVYSDQEIRDIFRKAQDKEEQVRILAELNGTDLETMSRKLMDLGLVEALVREKVSFDEIRAMELYNEGLCDLDIAETLGVGVQGFSVWRRKQGLPPHRKPGSGTAPGSRRKPKEKSIDELKAAPPVPLDQPMTVVRLLDILSDFAGKYPDATVYLEGQCELSVMMSVLCSPGCPAEAEVYLVRAD